ncbi:MAG TPA: DUF3710 domain-containing protein [Streptosporangiaceae bacterium]|nr:DUF3710 domain-containing protein [Streptosporangiaceae bacterium]
MAATSGPWDIADDYPEAERIDCGSLLVPVREGFDVQINVAEEQGAWVAVVQGESGMQLQAFAAPRGGGLWDDVRHEIAASIAESGGTCEESQGPAGVELRAQVPVRDESGPTGQPQPGQPQPGQPQPGQPQPGQPQPRRFLGFDGPRWFLRGVISGPAATDPADGDPFDELFADVVVVRGDYPAPPREQLEIRLPEEARQALEAQLAEENEGWGLADPFTRGPEITETR